MPATSSRHLDGPNSPSVPTDGDAILGTPCVRAAHARPIPATLRSRQGASTHTGIVLISAAAILLGLGFVAWAALGVMNGPEPSGSGTPNGAGGSDMPPERGRDPDAGAEVAAMAERIADKAKTLDGLLWTNEGPIEKYWQGIDACLVELGTMAKDHPGVAEVWYLKGRIETEACRFPEADADLAMALQLQPEHHLARLCRARLYAERHIWLDYGRIAWLEDGSNRVPDEMLEKALANVEQLEARPEDAKWTQDDRRLAALVEALAAVLTRNSPDSALDVLHKAGAVSPSEEYVEFAGWVGGMRGDYAAAAGCETKAIGLRPRGWRAYLHRGYARKALGDIDGAIADYGQALRMNPRWAEAFVCRGTARQAKGDFKGAIADCSAALEIDPRLAMAFNNRGDARYAQGDFTAAISDFDAALKIDPRYAEALNNRGNARYAKGDFDGAIEDCTAALKINPRFAEAFCFRGVARQAQGDIDGTISDCTEALNLAPRYAEAYCSRGTARETKGDVDNAIADYDEALKIKPHWAEALCCRGVARKAKGDRDGAMADFTEALTADPRMVLAFYYRGDLRHAAGDLDGAIADYEKVLETAPSDWPLRRKVEEALRRAREPR